ncbi:putative T7SS-secreted protein [Streptomyces erythrochromogenes]|uniref:putative T7SS-secreted protein n=1 Tax=Streptomyces erythrochromogenes TaxID=285574 RepID=UPI00343F9712
MGWKDFTPDSWEDWAEDRAEDLGDVIESGGGKLADAAEEVGLDKAGDWVRDKSRSAANQLGSDVAELELGQTEDPNKLVYGSVSKIRAQVSHLNDFKSSFTLVGNGLKGLEGDGLKGASADAFREAIAKEPPRWFKAAEAFGKAADAMGRFAETVEWAQGQAKEALADYNLAQKVSQDARTAYDKSITDYKAAVEAKKDTLPQRPADDFIDPADPLFKAAEDKLHTARTQRNEVAETARTAVRAARDAAPPKPSYSEQLKDGMDYLELAETHLAGGVLKGTAGLANFVRAVTPFDPYNLTHPAEYRTNLNSTAAGLVVAVNDPIGTGKQMLDDFMKDPTEGVGKFLPELAGSKGLGPAKKAATAARVADDVPTGPGRQGLDENGPNQSDTPDCDKKCDGTDPVDLATGRMFLPQTDIVLPGTLPLIFTRRGESGYTAGRWFGPAWASTIDQHLEIDPEGIVLVTEDGLAVAYPHPAPGVPVFPANGPRWPLERTPQGDYTVTDPALGRTRRFAAPLAEDLGEAENGYGLSVIDQIEDRNNNTITFEYDERGTPLGIAHNGGYHLRFETADGRITALHLTGGPRLLGYGYTDGHLTEVVNSSGLPLSFTYDERGRITSWTDTNDRCYTYAYDDHNRCTASGGADGHMALTLTYDTVDADTGLRVTTATTGAGHTSRYLIDDAYRVVASVDPLGAVTRHAYDHRGMLLAEADALGLVTRRSYDECGRLISLERPDGRVGRMEYNDLGLPTRVVNPDGRVFRQTYDDRGNRTSVTSPTGSTTQLDHDERGSITSQTNPLGAIVRIRSDAAGLPVSVTDPLGAVTRFDRDAFGRVVRFTDPLGEVTRMEWTVEGKPSRRTTSDGSTQSWTYDGEGNCLTYTDEAGGTTVYEYTDFDRLSARTSPDGVRYTFAYDTELRLVCVTAPHGAEWTYTYDPAGRLVSETDFDGRTVEYGYDAGGRLTSRVNGPGQCVRFARNALGQLIRKESSDGVTTYEFDVFDELAVATTPDGSTLSRLRDRHGRLLSESSDGRTLSYRYDELGRRVGRTTPAGVKSHRAFAPDGRVIGLVTSGRTVTFGRDAAGREVNRTVGSALTLNQQFDTRGRLTGQQVVGSDSTILQQRGYSYRDDGFLTGVEDTLNGDRSFSLDRAGRVTAVEAVGWSERYAYDETGNQASASWPQDHPGADARGERTYTGTRITRAGRVRYEHDDRGRVILRQRTRLSRKPDTWRYEWDAEDRLAALVTPDGTRWHYRYDALGRRIAKQRMAAGAGSEVREETVFTWDGTSLCEQRTVSGPSAPAAVTLTWDRDGHQPLTQTERVENAAQEVVDERFFAIVTDLIGTPVELVGEDGRIAWRTRSTIWGATTWNRDATAYTPLRFPGQYFDAESGLHYNYFRTYDPEAARYLSPDPLGLRPAPNPVAYVGNPLTRFDLLGLAPDPDCEELDAQIKKAKESWTSPASLSRHYGDHGRDLNIYDEGDYALAADELMSGPKPPGVREKESMMEGQVYRWDPNTNEFGTKDLKTGKIITYFDSSIRRDGTSTDANARRYWDEQPGLEQ